MRKIPRETIEKRFCKECGALISIGNPFNYRSRIVCSKECQYKRHAKILKKPCGSCLDCGKAIHRSKKRCRQCYWKSMVGKTASC